MTLLLWLRVSEDIVRPVPTFMPPFTEEDAEGSVYCAAALIVPSAATVRPEPIFTPPRVEEEAIGREYTVSVNLASAGTSELTVWPFTVEADVAVSALPIRLVI